MLTVQRDRVASAAGDLNDLLGRIDLAQRPEVVSEFSVFPIAAREQISNFCEETIKIQTILGHHWWFFI